ncbi:uncharacterized protein LOC126579696 [Anopheles aquasalis]|uniref:uncharacterized protein LOC126579696 n=1 Tax=Anopheles aquasalis TaxID=42839 RepID=UPI00215ACC1A|nr:uncharacterized protein LOC126579696 [Anopheles aquasalis]
MALEGDQEAAPRMLMAVSETEEVSKGGGAGEDDGALAQMVAYAAKLIEQQQQQQQQQYESEVPMVSMDGEAHPNMTLAAIGLGVLVALIILIILIAFITRRERSPHTKMTIINTNTNPIPTISQRLSSHTQPQSQPQVSRCVTFANDYELHDVVVTRM